MRLTRHDNTPIQEDDLVGLVNLPLHSIFNQIELSLQQTPLGHLGTNYPYKAYIDTLLKSSKTQQSNALTSQLLYKDTVDHDDSNVKTTSNTGLFNMALFTAVGKVVDMEGPLHLDLFQQSRYMLSGVEIGLKLWPSQNAFRLQTDVVDPNYKEQIVDARLKVCLQKLNPAILVAHENLFKKESAAIYPYLRSEIKTASIASGQFSFSADDMFQGLVPNRLIIGMVYNAAYMGDYKKSPFNFQTYDCDFIALYVDGQSLPAHPFQPNYSTGTYVDCYNMLTAYRKDIGIERREYVEGYCLYVLNLDPYYSFNTKRKGHCRLELKFTQALPESVTLIMYATFPEVLCIDQSRRMYIQ